MKRQHFIASATVAILIACCAAQAGPITLVGTVGNVSVGTAINNSGQSAGNDTRGSNQFIYRADSSGTVTDVGTSISNARNIGYAINASGEIAGEGMISSSSIDAPVVYVGTPGQGGQEYSLANNSYPSGIAYGINDSGVVVGGTSTLNNGSPFAYVGAPGSGQMFILDSTDAGTATGINNSGEIVGYVTPPGGNEIGFLYTGTPGSGTMVSLGALSTGGISLAFAINASGEIVGASGANTGSLTAMAYIGTPGAGGMMYSLGSFGPKSRATAINSAGDIVGWTNTTGGPTDAFIYVGTPGAGGEMIDLNTWLASVDPTDAANWHLTEAYGINDSDLVTGYGIYTVNGQNYMTAYLLDVSSLIASVPEPTSLSILAVGLLGLSRPRRGR